jgi:hypothetical protein
MLSEVVPVGTIVTWIRDGETCWTRLKYPVTLDRFPIWPHGVGYIRDRNSWDSIPVQTRGTNEVLIRGYLRWRVSPFAPERKD